MRNVRMAFAIAAVGFAVLFGGRAPVQAAPLSATPLASVSQLADQTGSGAMQKVDWRSEYCWRHPGNWRCHERHNYCGRWRHECADRWGWNTWRFRRCLRWHEC